MMLGIRGETARMGGLVEDLLLLAELDRGRPLVAEPVGLHRICADVVDDANAMAHGLAVAELMPRDSKAVAEIAALVGNVFDTD